MADAQSRRADGVTLAENEQPSFCITIRATPGTVPVTIRLRRLVKTALRAFGFKVLEIRELRPNKDGRQEMESSL
jgi:hypothetical protein